MYASSKCRVQQYRGCQFVQKSLSASIQHNKSPLYSLTAMATHMLVINNKLLTTETVPVSVSYLLFLSLTSNNIQDLYSIIAKSKLCSF